MSSWTPDIPNMLLCSKIEAAKIEETTTKVWKEFLEGYFDGEEHLGREYPKASVKFGQTPPPAQELDGVYLHIVSIMDQVHSIRRMGGGYSLFDGLKWELFVKARLSTAVDANGLTADGLSQRTADTLYGLLSRFPEMVPLNRAGLYLIRPSPPKLVASTAYFIRRILITGRTRAAI
jgi:hypothetical protein